MPLPALRIAPERQLPGAAPRPGEGGAQAGQHRLGSARLVPAPPPGGGAGLYQGAAIAERGCRREHRAASPPPAPGEEEVAEGRAGDVTHAAGQCLGLRWRTAAPGGAAGLFAPGARRGLRAGERNGARRSSARAASASRCPRAGRPTGRSLRKPPCSWPCPPTGRSEPGDLAEVSSVSSR